MLTGLLIMGAVALFLVTSLVGRVWCGYTCPQTVWTDLFMWVERGSKATGMSACAATPARDADTILRKTLKHWVWLGIAFWTGGAWIMYFVDAPTVMRPVLDAAGAASRSISSPPVYRDDLSAGRLGARAGLHLYVPVAALPVGDAGRADLPSPTRVGEASRAAKDGREIWTR